jgi:RNA-directed DNA polymerase
VNIGAPWPDLDEAEKRVHQMQTKLHQWATSDPGRRFDDLYNLVYDPAFLVVAWSRVRGNRGARTAGVDGVRPRSIGPGTGELLAGLRGHLKARRYVPTGCGRRRFPRHQARCAAWG